MRDGDGGWAGRVGDKVEGGWGWVKLGRAGLMGRFSTSRPSDPLFFLFLLQVNVCVLEVNECVLQVTKASPRLTPYRLGVRAVAHRLASPYRFKNLGID